MNSNLWPAAAGRRRRKPFALAVAVALAGGVAPLTTSATPATFINFEAYNTGTVMTNQLQASDGMTISADNYHAGHPDKCMVYDSSKTNTPDADLEFGGMWSAGNIKNVPLNKFMIIGENAVDTSPADGFVDAPDDEADGGTMFMKFAMPKTQIGFDLIDVELTPETDHIDFLRNGVLLKSITFDKFAKPGPFFRPGIVYADRSANRIAPITVNDIGGVAFDEVRFYLPECAAIDNVMVSDVVPEPGMISLLGVAGAGAALARRRR